MQYIFLSHDVDWRRQGPPPEHVLARKDRFDPEIFDKPDEFNIQRENADKHLAFGIGRHTCLGKPVALMQLQEFYSQFLVRFKDFEMNGDWKVAPNNFVHAIQEMPIKFTPIK